MSDWAAVFDLVNTWEGAIDLFGTFMIAGFGWRVGRGALKATMEEKKR